MPGPIVESHLYRTIQRQPADWRELLDRRDAALEEAARRLGRAARILLVGTGTSYHAAQLGSALLRAAGRDARAEHSHDVAHYPFPVGAGDVVVVITHTGWKSKSLRC